MDHGVAASSSGPVPLAAAASPARGVLVCARIRPRNARADLPHGVDAFVVNSNSVSVRSGLGRDKLADRAFAFNSVFDPAASQADVFERVVRPIVDTSFGGINGTVMCYGQTGSGKTFTMLGGPSGAPPPPAAAASAPDAGAGVGMLPRAIAHLFHRIDASPDSLEFTIRVSIVEIYMERVRDLLAEAEEEEVAEERGAAAAGGGAKSPPPPPQPQPQQSLSIHEDPVSKSMYVEGAASLYVGSAAELLELARAGLGQRALTSTQMNDTSSRSHAVITIHLVVRDDAARSTRASKLSFVDLAGSENAHRSGATGHVLEEAGMINRSLLSLSQCIDALAAMEAMREGAAAGGGGASDAQAATATAAGKELADASAAAPVAMASVAATAVAALSNEASPVAPLSTAAAEKSADGLSKAASGDVIVASSAASPSAAAAAAAGGGAPAAASTKPFIPYRNSKLTRLLQDSLGGNAHTVLIICLSPCSSNLTESLSSLRFGDRARFMRNRPIVNRVRTMEELQHLLARAELAINAQAGVIAKLQARLGESEAGTAVAAGTAAAAAAADDKAEGKVSPSIPDGNGVGLSAEAAKAIMSTVPVVSKSSPAQSSSPTAPASVFVEVEEEVEEDNAAGDGAGTAWGRLVASAASLGSAAAQRAGGSGSAAVGGSGMFDSSSSGDQLAAVQTVRCGACNALHFSHILDVQPSTFQKLHEALCFSEREAQSTCERLEKRAAILAEEVEDAKASLAVRAQQLQQLQAQLHSQRAAAATVPAAEPSASAAEAAATSPAPPASASVTAESVDASRAAQLQQQLSSLILVHRQMLRKYSVADTECYELSEALKARDARIEELTQLSLEHDQQLRTQRRDFDAKMASMQALWKDALYAAAHAKSRARGDSDVEAVARGDKSAAASADGGIGGEKDREGDEAAALGEAADAFLEKDDGTATKPSRLSGLNQAEMSPKVIHGGLGRTAAAASADSGSTTMPM